MRLDPNPREVTVRLLRETNNQVNAITEGNAHAHHGARTAAPTTGTWNQGDRIRNSAPAEAGAASSKYVVLEWVCTVGGTPGTWLECRTLTGN